ncbi:MAG: hypothetical protein U0872_02500 [Planctomycetaceae bacterium]
MKTALFSLALLFVVTPLDRLAKADGLIQRLPSDGGWVKYQWSMAHQGQQTAGTLTMSAVGTMMINQEACRWLEFQLTTGEKDAAHALLIKVCVTETAVQNHSELGAGVRRMWFKIDDELPTEKLSPADAPEWLHAVQGVLTGVFSPLDKGDELADKEIAFQRGSFKCQGWAESQDGETVTLMINGKPVPSKMITKRSLWVHRDIPFGTAECTVETQIDDQQSTARNTTMMLVDFGVDAQSALPNHN